MTEIILGPIIGGLSHERVNLWARADKTATLHAWLGTRPNGTDAKLVGKTQLKAATGFAGIVTLDKLGPAKKYFFALTLDPKVKPAKSAFHSFLTFPAPGKAKSFRFAFGSCFLPYRPEPGLAFKHLLENQRGISFLLMLGDQIYADLDQLNGLGHIAVTPDDYRRVYQHVWSNPHHRTLLAQMPTFMILDDHEVDNDWHFNDRGLTQPDISFINRFLRWLKGKPKDEQVLSPARMNAALQVNWEHQAIHAPTGLSPRGPLACEFEYGKAAFFVMDTRTQRFINGAERQLLGAKQWNMLEAWLLRVKDTHPVKFVVSSISVLSDMIGDFTNDRWTGFKEERNRLLFFLAEHGIEGVHFLVGDLHSAHSISANVKGPNRKTIPVWEFCSSPFEQKAFEFAHLLDQPASSPALYDRKRHFSVSEINYGIVEVDFTKKNAPRVRVELNYEKDGVWYKK